jgi:hypothetical protein
MSILHLFPGMFTPQKKLVAEHGGMRAHAFCYPTGVAAIELQNAVGHVIWLPFQGQQIWDAVFHGRRLTMGSPFDQPLPTREYLATYGAFFIHCGGTAMGNPGPDDDHPPHGELPNLPFDTAQLVLGYDDGRAWVDLTGSGRDRLAFSHDFTARPRLRLHADSAEITAEIVVENSGPLPMPFAYLAHINFRPVDGADLHDALADDRRDLALREPGFTDMTPDSARALHALLRADPARHRRIEPGPILPELVATMALPAGTDGWTHALQLHADGLGDAVSYRPADLPYAVRWMSRGGDMEALGLVLPATALPDGRAAARRKGQMLTLPPGAIFRSELRISALRPPETEAMAARIALIRNGTDCDPTT